jgi:GNAT superfamily N-acetyltransferase
MLERLIDASIARWHEIDPLLPLYASTKSNGGNEFVIRGRSGDPLGVITSDLVCPPLNSLKATWGPAKQLRLTTRVVGHDPGAELDELITQWRRSVPNLIPASQDSCATLSWPSRDAVVAPTLLAHGFNPCTILAARPTGRPSGIRRDIATIRRANPDDAKRIAKLWLDLVYYDAHFGAVFLRDSTSECLYEETLAALSRSDPWIWVAELDGSAVGFLRLSAPQDVDWLQGYVTPRSAAYLNAAYVAPKMRGLSIGASLVARAHRLLDEQDVDVTLLHYSPANPLSTPFWNRMGYRPLWTTWRAQPAFLIR